MKTIREIFRFFNRSVEDDRPIKDVEENSKKVKQGYLFIAIGKGNDYVDESMAKGATQCLSDKIIPNLETKLLSFYMWFYDVQSLPFFVLGVTGTTGKSSTAYLFHKLLKKSLLITNVPKIKNSYLIKNTTPYPLSLVRSFVLAKKKKKKILILELSSIAMDSKRIHSLVFDVIILTNLGSDHLDYHKTLKKYQAAKIDFINEYGQLCFAETNILKEQKITTPFIKEVKAEGLDFRHLSIKNKIVHLKTYESQYALAYAFFNEFIKAFPYFKTKRIHRIKPLKGRMTVVRKHPLIVVDYAHTEMAFESVLSLFEKEKERVTVVFGAGGNRDKQKRHVFGELALKYARRRIVTEDNSREENLDEIINDIVGKKRNEFTIIERRKDAIRFAIKTAKKDEIVLILGKGHEQTIIRNNQEIPFSDIYEARRWSRL